jgi:hypothetical protein
VDTFSHAAWGYATLRAARPTTPAGRSQRTIRWWWAALAGAAPDLLFFIPSRVEALFTRGLDGLTISAERGIWRADGPPMPAELIEVYFRYYVKTHSFVVLAVACALLWLAGQRRWLWLAVPFALHILMDMPTHERYLTQPFWPLSSWRIQGLAWSDPRIFFPHLTVLVGVFVWLKATRRI